MRATGDPVPFNKTYATRISTIVSIVTQHQILVFRDLDRTKAVVVVWLRWHEHHRVLGAAVLLHEKGVAASLVVIHLIDDVIFEPAVGCRLVVDVELVVTHRYYIARYANDTFNEELFIRRRMKSHDFTVTWVAPLGQVPGCERYL